VKRASKAGKNERVRTAVLFTDIASGEMLASPPATTSLCIVFYGASISSILRLGCGGGYDFAFGVAEDEDVAVRGSGLL